MGVRGLLSYVLRHNETLQQVDLAQEARHGRHGPAAVNGGCLFLGTLYLKELQMVDFLGVRECGIASHSQLSFVK